MKISWPKLELSSYVSAVTWVHKAVESILEAAKPLPGKRQVKVLVF